MAQYVLRAAAGNDTVPILIIRSTKCRQVSNAAPVVEMI